MKKKKAFVFDFDGTLVDSFKFVDRVLLETINKYSDHEVLFKDIKPHFGKTEEGVIEEFTKSINNQIYGDFIKRYYRLHDEYIPEFYPGIRELLEELMEKDVTVILLSARGKETLNISLTKLDAFKYFDGFYTGTKEGVIKDEKLKKVMRDFNFTNDEMLYIGDSTKDVEQCRLVDVDILSVTFITDRNMDSLNKINPGNICSSVEDLRKRLLECIE